MRFEILEFAILVVLTLAQLAPAANPARYVALWSDGNRSEGSRLSGWHAANGTPQLDGRSLLDEGTPFRWLRDRSIRTGERPAAFVELSNGDRLPGTTVSYQNGNPDSYEPLAPHFVVEPSVAFYPPKSSPADSPRVRVVAKFVRRIVWQARALDRYEPGTLFYRDGRTVAFRAARFGDGFVDLLLSDGPRKSSFREIAEIHLPRADDWEQYVAELATLSIGDRSRLLQVETSGGLIATGSLDRFDAAARGKPDDADQWVHALQPAWSLDLLWISCGEIWIRRLLAPHEVPLSRIYPTASRNQSLLSGGAWNWQANRNVHGAPLAGGEHEFGWGFGVQATSELHFPLPPYVASFRSQVGLDRAASTGGCVRARIYVNSTGSNPLFESGYLVGSNARNDTGAIGLTGPSGGQRELILQIDAAHQGRPQGADPLDIRDIADWFDPLLTLDPAKLKTEIQQRSAAQIPAWEGWELANSDGGEIRWTSFPDDWADPPGAFGGGVVAVGKPLVIRRRLKLDDDANWLVMAVSRRKVGGEAPRLEVRVNGTAVAERRIPVREGKRSNASLVTIPLADFRSGEEQEIDLAIAQLPGAESAPVVWQAIHFARQLPTLFRLLEDDERFVVAPRDDVAPEQQGTAALFDGDAHSGRASLKVTPQGMFTRQLSATIRIREKPAWGEYRYLRFAFRKSGAGRVCLELNHAGGAVPVARYDAGQGDPCWGTARRVWVAQLPNDWIVMTRDLYSEFGALDVTGVTVSVPDGDYALFDHIYLARTEKDFNDALPSVPAK